MRQAQLDGVRGLGVVVVIAFHHNLQNRVLNGLGNVWMDVFFVISGFLITRGLLQTRTHTHYWKQFYVRRAGRILPPLLLTLLIAPLFATGLHPAAWLAYAFFLGNIVNLTPYSNEVFFAFWSLAIEEHFYILWPIVVKVFTPRRTLHLALAIITVSPVLRWVATPYLPTWRYVFFLTFFRLDSLAAGTLLALLPMYPRALAALRRWSAPAGLLTAATFLAAYKYRPMVFCWGNNTAVFNGLGYTLSVVFSFCAVAYLTAEANDRSLVSRFFALRPLVFLGEISYGMYLCHPVVIVAAHRFFFPTESIFVALPRLFWLDLPIVVALSWLSFRFYESPLLEWTRRKAKAFDLERPRVQTQTALLGVAHASRV